MPNNELARIAAIKAAMMQTTGTQGWNYIKQMADNLSKKFVQAAIDEEDKEKRDYKIAKAKAFQDGLKELFDAIETTKHFKTETDEGQDDGFQILTEE